MIFISVGKEAARSSLPLNKTNAGETLAFSEKKEAEQCPPLKESKTAGRMPALPSYGRRRGGRVVFSGVTFACAFKAPIKSLASAFKGSVSGALSTNRCK
jgi:hypothetical protein